MSRQPSRRTCDTCAQQFIPPYVAGWVRLAAYVYRCPSCAKARADLRAFRTGEDGK